MATDKQHTTLNVPTLRFPEFSGEWEKTNLGSLITMYSGGTPSIDITEYWDGNIPFISATSMHDTYIYDSQLHLSKKGLLKGSKLLPSWNLLLLVRGSMLWNRIPICINTVDVAFNQDVKGIIATGISTFFLLNWFQSKENRIKYLVSGTGIGAGKLDTADVASLTVSYPDCNEQQKVATLFRIIDERIATQRKVIERLETLINGIRECVFCPPNREVPKIRCKGYTSPYETYKLGDCCRRVTRKNKYNESDLVLTIAAKKGMVAQIEYFNNSVASNNLQNYYLLEKGDFAYNKSYSTDYPWGAIKPLVMYDKGVLSSLYICFRPNEALLVPEYLAHYFETVKWHKGIKDIAGEGARNHGLLNISIEDFFNTMHRFPKLDEQVAVTKLLESIDNKIAQEYSILCCYETQRTYLLSTLFI